MRTALSVSAVSWPAPAQQQGFVFDSHAWLDRELTYSFERAGPTRDANGALVPADTPRWTTPQLLCGAPDVATVAGTGLPIQSIDVLATGVDANGATPVFVVYNQDQGRLQIHRNTIAGSGFETLVPLNPAKGGFPDMLDGSADERPDEAWIPKGAVVCHGAVVVLCNVAKPATSGGWMPQRIGFVLCSMDRLAGAPSQWWSRHAMSDPLTSGTDLLKIGKTWAMPGWWALDDADRPVTAWIASADYRTFPFKNGGVFVAFPLVRTAPQSGAWMAGPAVELPGRWTLPNGNVTHAHAVGLARYGDHGIIAFGSRGDSLYHAANYTWTIDDEVAYLDGATPRSGALNWHAPGTRWTGPKEVSGFVGSAADPIDRRSMGNQWIGLSPGPQPDTFLCGSDEVADALWITRPLTDDPDAVEFINVYPASPTNTVVSERDMPGSRRRFLSFHVRAENQNRSGPFAAALAPSQFDTDHVLTNRVLFSPDGVTWGQAWAHSENEQVGPHVAAGRIWVGSLGQALGLGIRSTPIPATRALRALRTGAGGMNFIDADADAFDVPATVTVVDNPTFSATVPPPPCLGPAYHVRSAPPTNATASAFLGTFRLTDSLPGNTKRASLRLWVRPDPPSQGGRAGALALKFRLRTFDPDQPIGSTKVSGYCEPITVCGSGSWFPIVMTTDISAWGGQPGLTPLDLLLVTDNGTALPCSFYLAVDSLSDGASPSWPGTPRTLLGSESAEITGFSHAGDYTAFIAAMTPFDSWDRTDISASPPARPLWALVNASGSRWVQFFADAELNALSARVWNGTAYQTGASITGISWVVGSPILCGASFDAAAGTLRVRASVGGTEIGGFALSAAALGGPFETIRFGDGSGIDATPLDVFGGMVEGRKRTSAELDAALRSLSFLPAAGACPADFDRDGFASGDDFDLFVSRFELGDADADFNGDGFVSADDYDAFAEAFEQGC